MSPEVLARLEELVRAGATVVGPKPRRAPGQPAADVRVREIANRLWGRSPGRGRVVPDRTVR